MDFQEVLRELVENTEGGLAGILMDLKQGIPVAQYRGASESTDVETVGAEYSVILKDIRQAAQSLQAGKANEVAIRAERLVTVIRLLNDDYFVALTLKPEGNLGKARFMLRTRAEQILSGL